MRAGRGLRAIADETDTTALPRALLSLLFAPGTRPSATEIEALAGREGAFAVTHRPPAGEGWLELLINGLTFDCRGLAPADPAPWAPVLSPPPGVDGLAFGRLEAVSLAPGPHLAGGEAMLPVVRGLVGLAAALAQGTEAQAILWHPSLRAVEPAGFIAQVEQWLAGGVFPGLALTGLTREGDGSLHTEGLAFFIGQELRLEPGGGASAAEDAKLALRLIDRLAATGAIRQAVRVEPLPGQLIELVPDEGGALVRAWRRAV